jgi:hypothetical protein
MRSLWAANCTTVVPDWKLNKWMSLLVIPKARESEKGITLPGVYPGINRVI